MNEIMAQNNEVAATQEIDSQLVISQQFYTCEDYLNVWGTLKETNGDVFSLKSKITHFGREAVKTFDTNEANYVFQERKIRREIFERISKHHFSIERKMLIDPAAPNFEPAIITCKGRNGLTVGSSKLSQGERRILKDGDCIYLPMNFKLFYFTYTKCEEGYVERSCEIHDRFYIGPIIGRGGCGEIRQVTTVAATGKDKTGRPVFEEYAIKCLLKPLEDSLSQSKEAKMKGLRNEINIMRQINYVHMLRLFEVYESSTYIYLLFPLMRGGDLLTKIIQSPLRHFTESDSKYYFTQLVLGLKYLHSKGITHRDIKPDNILLTDRGENPILMISDFGLSKMNDVMVTQCGTEVYVAPEVMKKRTNYTNAVDIWSAGVFLYAMLSGKMAFVNNRYGTARDNILAGRYEFHPSYIWDKLPTAKSIVNFMLQMNPRNRLSAAQLAAHTWLKDESVKKRLERAYQENNCQNVYYFENEDSLTEDLEKTLVNVSISEEPIHPPKRQKLDKKK